MKCCGNDGTLRFKFLQVKMTCRQGDALLLHMKHYGNDGARILDSRTQVHQTQTATKPPHHHPITSITPNNINPVTITITVREREKKIKRENQKPVFSLLFFTIPRSYYKKLVTYVQPHESAVSLLESGE